VADCYPIGDNICPGRQFAVTEILAIAGFFIVGFEIEMPNGSPYEPPPFEKMKMIAGVHRPAHDVEVRVKRRAGLEDVEWTATM
jgi:hypothetical protein